MPVREIYLVNDLGEMGRLNTFIMESVSDWGLDDELQYQLNLVAEEVITNIILYGFARGKTGEQILLELSFGEGKLQLRVTDHGKAFDPLKVPPPGDLDKPVRERKIGGLGVYFIRQLMDSIEYQRINDSNILTLTKQIS